MLDRMFLSSSVEATDPNFNQVSLLLHGDGSNGAMNNTFLDSSTNNFTITRNGNTTQGSFSPFSGNGGSAYFDGNGDFLQTPQSTALAANSTDYTVEGWFYFNAATYSAFDLVGRGLASDFLANANGRWIVSINSSGNLEFAEQDALGANSVTVTDPSPITTRQWIHFAAVKSGTTMRLFKNGTQVATATSAVRTAFSGRLNIGQATTDTSYRGFFLGNISNVRFVNGSALYSSNFTPPTAPLTAISGTALLCNFTNAGIIDSAKKNDLETVGNAQISTSVKKFGTGSMAFDGTGDWLLTADTPDLRLGTGNFTIEFWVYLNAIGAVRGFVGKGGASTGWLVSLTSTNGVRFTYATSTITSTGTLAASTWYYIAVVREGTGTNQTKIYINGTNDGTGTVSTNFNQTENMYIGANRTGGDALNGYIDDLRITKGVARYTSNFTPPTAPFPDN